MMLAGVMSTKTSVMLKAHAPHGIPFQLTPQKVGCPYDPVELEDSTQILCSYRPCKEILNPENCNFYIEYETQSSASVKVHNCGLGPHADQTAEMVRI